MLRLILSASGVEAGKVAVKQFGTDQIEELARDPTLNAFMTVGPLDSKITSDAIAATARAQGEPKFLAIEASEAIALKHPRYESEEIPPSIFNANPAWPDDKVETVSVSHLIVAQKTLSETTVAAFFMKPFAVRQAIARQVPGAAHNGSNSHLLQPEAGVPFAQGALDSVLEVDGIAHRWREHPVRDQTNAFALAIKCHRHQRGAEISCLDMPLLEASTEPEVS